jgi:hypothetical protein
MAENCPIPSCDGVLYYDTCEECGHRETPPTSRKSGEDYKREIQKLQRMAGE